MFVIREHTEYAETDDQQILSIIFHPRHPHILASASEDRTIRIWNMFGTDVVLENGDFEPLSENYPQGDADEGNYAVAILAGHQGGHKAGVSALVSLVHLLEREFC
jgi:WD40 repeat protein